MITFFSAALSSRCGALAGAAAAVGALPLPGALAGTDAPLFPGGPLLPGAPPAPGGFADGNPPAQADSANPAANSVTTLNLLACKGLHSWLEIADAGDGKIRAGRDLNEPQGLAVLRIRMKLGGQSRQSLRLPRRLSSSLCD
jgi:hypothetical protein